MTNESFAWLFFTLGFIVAIVAIGVLAAVAAIFESQWQRRRDRNERLPEPNCRARVYRRWGVPE